MSALYYQPAPGDPAKTTVDRFKFDAYQPTEVEGWLYAKLISNAWFGETIDADRQRLWLDSLTT
jgi:hypothetical protein